MKTLILTVGLPRSGKSSWAMGHGAPVVNPDSIRLALHGRAFAGDAEPMVWVLAKYFVRSLFIAGHPTVILDATNTTKGRRAHWKSQEWYRQFKVFPTTKEVCLERTDGDNKDGLIRAIHRMSDSFQPVTEDELELPLL